MIALAVLVALAQEGAGSGTTVETAPIPATPAEPAAPADGAITTDAPAPLTLAAKPSPIRRTKPSGPTSAKYFPEDAGVSCEGSIAVDKEGKATGVTMLSDLETCPEPFQKACMRAMKYWKFLPAQMDGRAIASDYKAKVTFHKDGTVDGADAQ
jgi:hypothetical protein